MIETEQKFLSLGKPDITHTEEDWVLHVLRSGWLGYGEVAQKFEKEFAAYLGVENALATPSCTIGLILALKISGIGQGHEVITSPLTFAATVNAILAVGAKPVFVDVDKYGGIDPRKIELAVNKRTKAIVPVHLWGAPCNMNWINRIAYANSLIVIEDAAHAFGGNFFGQPLGTLGDFGVFSFYPTKNITSGDGGMVVTQDPKKARELRTLASQGLSEGAWSRYSSGPVKNYQVTSVGCKGLMNDLSAALGLAQLQRWPEMKEKREKVFKVYEKAFGKKIHGHSQHIYEIRVEKRDDFRTKMHEQGIGTGVHYNPLHLEPAYQFLGRGFFPMAEEIGEKTVSLPLSNTMSEDDAYRVVEETIKLRGEIWKPQS